MHRSWIVERAGRGAEQTVVAGTRRGARRRHFGCLRSFALATMRRRREAEYALCSLTQTRPWNRRPAPGAKLTGPTAAYDTGLVCAARARRTGSHRSRGDGMLRRRSGAPCWKFQRAPFCALGHGNDVGLSHRKKTSLRSQPPAVGRRTATALASLRVLRCTRRICASGRPQGTGATENPRMPRNRSPSQNITVLPHPYVRCHLTVSSLHERVGTVGALAAAGCGAFSHA